MALNKLHKKDFTIAVKTGTESNKNKFAKECAKGELYFATDTNKLYVANSDAGTSDSVLSEITSSSQYDPAYAASQLSYTGGLFTSSNYNISTQPIMHFDAAILDGADQTNNPSSGTAVSTWGDRSGQATNYDATQATGSAQPTFTISGSDKYVSFDGGDVLDLANSYSRASTNEFTIVQVGNANSSGSIYYLAPNVGATYGSVQLGKYSNGVFYVRAGTLATSRDYSTFNMLTAIRTSSDTLEVFRDGDSSEGSISSSHVAATFDFDSIGPSGSTKTTGRIYECMLFDSVLSNTDLNTINSYLANKYSALPTLTTWT